MYFLGACAQAPIDPRGVPCTQCREQLVASLAAGGSAGAEVKVLDAIR